MNYQKIYRLLIEKADNRCILPSIYKESHHIIPLCISGSSDKENLVDLFPEEHFIAHQLLVKIYPRHHGLARAANMMTVHSSNQHRNNKRYAWLRERYSIAQKNRIVSIETRKKISKTQTGRKLTPEWKENIRLSKQNISQETKEKISNSLKGRIFSKPWRLKISKTSSENYKNLPTEEKLRRAKLISEKLTGVKRKPFSDDWKNNISKAKKGIAQPEASNQKRSDTLKNKPSVECPYCKKVGHPTPMKRYHFLNCKLKPA